MSHGSGTSIRLAVPDDAIELAEVHVASWRAAYRGLIADEVLAQLDPVARAEVWRRMLGAAGGACYVAITNGRIAGFVHLQRCRDADKDARRTGEITSLYVHPDHWRERLGSALLHRGLSELSAQAVDEVMLWVLAENARGRSFYERHGFEVDGSEKVHRRSGLVEVRYVLAVPGTFGEQGDGSTLP